MQERNVGGRNSPIGVFDSGIGGLTVLKALQRRLPNESYIYLGDTARLPYGTKTGETVLRYAMQAAEILIDSGVKLLVIACNTASAHALNHLQEAFPQIPIIGVIEPGAEAACAASSSGVIAVMSTESTARAHAYPAAIHRICPQARVTSIACSLMVGLAEEGWLEGSIPLNIAERYLNPVFTSAHHPDTLILGCTHFPLLTRAIQAAVGADVTLIDSGAVTANHVAAILQTENLCEDAAARPHVRFLATDGCERFAKVAHYFLDHAITPAMVELIDLGFTPGCREDRQAHFVQRKDPAILPAQKQTAG